MAITCDPSAGIGKRKQDFRVRLKLKAYLTFGRYLDEIVEKSDSTIHTCLELDASYSIAL